MTIISQVILKKPQKIFVKLVWIQIRSSIDISFDCVQVYNGIVKYTTKNTKKSDLRFVQIYEIFASSKIVCTKINFTLFRYFTKNFVKLHNSGVIFLEATGHIILRHASYLWDLGWFQNKLNPSSGTAIL